MQKLLFLILLSFCFQNCTVYKIINVTDQGKRVFIGMKIHNEVNTQYNINAIEQAKNVIVKEKSLSKQDGSDILNYEIEIKSNETIKLTDLIKTKESILKITHDSIDIRLSSGQPIFINSDSIKVNNFKLMVLPWLKRVYYYTIR